MAFKQYRTEMVKTQFLKLTDFLFENEEFLTFQKGTNEFSDPQNRGKDILHGVIRVFVSSTASPKQAVKYDKKPKFDHAWRLYGPMCHLSTI